jgi:CubicO group peptidase (beta-lactamase class C family)
VRCLLALLAASIATPLASVAHAEPAPEQVDALRVRATAAGFDGTVLVGSADGSQASFTTGQKPVRTNVVWRWASITKQLAAVIAMQEVAAGRLDLDAPIASYWPEWRGPAAKQIRIRDLLMHRSGLPQPDESTPDADEVPGFYRAIAATPAANGFCAGPQRAALPTDFNYNNCDSIVLAEVLARVTGKPFATLLRERISKPLKLRSFGLYALGPVAAKHVRPVGEFADKDPLLNMGVYGASGGAYGTIADLWRFDHALLNGKLVSAAQREAMWQSTPENGFYGFFQWIYPAPLAGCDKPVRIVERQGLIGGIELRNYLLPETGRGLILFSRKRPTNLGDPWEGKGLAFDLLSSVACSK